MVKNLLSYISIEINCYRYLIVKVNKKLNNIINTSIIIIQKYVEQDNKVKFKKIQNNKPKIQTIKTAIHK